jgi:lipopolysaccharide transport system permease protein/teichoic acid transport system permease protein
MKEYLNLKSFYLFIKNLIKSRWLIIQLTKKEFKERYATSFFGSLWAFIQPLITIVVFWFVFEYGLKAGTITGTNTPFILWLISGLVPWFFFSDSFITAGNSIVEKAYLVKKVVFQVPILPVIKIVTSVVVHLAFVILTILIFLIYGYIPTLYYIQIIYYLIACFIFLIGISWITSSLSVFTGDVAQILSVLVQIGFWATPILWNLEIIPDGFSFIVFILKLNPMNYIVQGYRDSFINGVWFWERPILSIYFWVLTIAIWLIGIVIFKKLRPHFADVL